MGASFGVYFSTLGSLIVISISAWPILLLIVPLSLVYYWYQVSLKNFSIGFIEELQLHYITS